MDREKRRWNDKCNRGRGNEEEGGERGKGEGKRGRVYRDWGWGRENRKGNRTGNRNKLK